MPEGHFLTARLYGDDAEKDIRVYLRKQSNGWQVVGLERGWKGKAQLQFADARPAYLTRLTGPTIAQPHAQSNRGE